MDDQSKAFEVEADRISALLKPVIAPLHAALGLNAEVVLHNLARLPQSIVSIAGNLSGRTVGSPASDMALEDAYALHAPENRIGYLLEMPGGVVCKSSTIFLKGAQERPVVAICINVDISGLTAARDALNALTALTAIAEGERPHEQVYTDVDSLANAMLRDAVDAVGVPVTEMSRAHKMRVIRTLEQRGFFLIREAAEKAGVALHVTRYTVYNYLSSKGNAHTS